MHSQPAQPVECRHFIWNISPRQRRGVSRWHATESSRAKREEIALRRQLSENPLCVVARFGQPRGWIAGSRGAISSLRNDVVARCSETPRRASTIAPRATLGATCEMKLMHFHRCRCVSQAPTTTLLERHLRAASSRTKAIPVAANASVLRPDCRASRISPARARFYTFDFTAALCTDAPFRATRSQGFERIRIDLRFRAIGRILLIS